MPAAAETPTRSRTPPRAPAKTGRAAAQTPAPTATVAGQIGRRISRGARATPARVYTPFNFLDLGTPHSVGMAQVTSERIAHLCKTLSAKDRAQLLKDLPLAPAWMHPHLRFIADAPLGRRVQSAL